MALAYDIHLSAYAILPETIRQIERVGFRRDAFCNNSRCDTTVYHGTYRGSIPLPSDQLWQEVESILLRDHSFIGGLEQESYDPQEVKFIFSDAGLLPPAAQPFCVHPPSPGQCKRCDIHINISLHKSSHESVALVHCLCLPSFDKYSLDGTNRIYSVTCDDAIAGAGLYETLFTYLTAIPKLSAKLKFERTEKCLRLPAHAPALPIITAMEAIAWSANVPNTYLS